MTRFAWTTPGRLIPAILADCKKRMNSPIQKVRGVWGRAVGPEIAAHTSPLACRDRLLIISVDSPVWKAELAQFHREKILRALSEVLGSEEIRDLRFVARPARGARLSPHEGEKKHAGAAD